MRHLTLLLLACASATFGAACAGSASHDGGDAGSTPDSTAGGGSDGGALGSGNDSSTSPVDAPSDRADLATHDADGGSSSMGAEAAAVDGATGGGSTVFNVDAASEGGGTIASSTTVAPSDGLDGSRFGWSIAFGGSTLLVGAPGAMTGAGAVYAFAGDGGTWSETSRIVANDGAAAANFGASVAYDLDTAVIGASGASAPLLYSGAAYVFVQNAGKWNQQAKLTAGTLSSYLGDAVAISGDTAIVGAPGNVSAYVFVRAAQSWSLQQQLGGSVSSLSDFGKAVAIDGETALVGAPGAGAVYVFQRTGTSWSQTAMLTSSGGAGHDGFGTCVAFHGASALLCAQGSVYAFQLGAAGWTQQAKVFSGFSSAGAISGSKAVIGRGCSSCPGAGLPLPLLTSTSDSWTQTAQLVASGTNAGFGISVALSSTHAFVGETQGDAPGTVYAFPLP